MREWLKITVQIKTEMRALAFCWLIVFITLVMYTCVHLNQGCFCHGLLNKSSFVANCVINLSTCAARQNFPLQKL